MTRMRVKRPHHNTLTHTRSVTMTPTLPTPDPDSPQRKQPPRSHDDFAAAVLGDPVFTNGLPGNFVRLDDLPTRRRTQITKALEALIEKPTYWAVVRVFEADASHKNPNQHYHSARQLAVKIEGNDSSKGSIECIELAEHHDGTFETAVATDRKRSAVSARFVPNKVKP